jgi:hypothetical protein
LGRVSEGQKCEPFSAPLHTIVPLKAGDSDGEEDEEEDAEDGEEGAVEVLAAGQDDTEDFAPRALNPREESPVLRLPSSTQKSLFVARIQLAPGKLNCSYR